jgi:hypothetical protein
MQKTLKPLHNQLPTFKLTKHWIENPKPSLVLNHDAISESFRNLWLTLPRTSGHIIVFGHTQYTKTVIAVISSNGDIRHAFRKINAKELRLAWCLHQLQNKGYTKLSFQMAKEK